MTSKPLIERQSQTEKLSANIDIGQHTIITGDVGIGKTVLLKQAVSHLERVIYVESSDGMHEDKSRRQKTSKGCIFPPERLDSLRSAR